ncbi:YhcN/YlaJ family sporulation lipoprotein [Anoxybacteroides tepidamans]|uniref:YhcN/YlaJ family sporulation lipoprotein n=1 Tax=Anoxybacteroides tepidamans TaxID=265948 RepID=UPI00068853CD|nr:YhcN/YlaJ family sporulation lipoprotein [Anoxybacillus tepidamans]
MRRTIATIGIFCCVSGLAACANYAEDRTTRYRDDTRPIGYYSTDRQDAYNRYGMNRENHGNAYIIDNRNGPLSDLLDTNTNQGRYDASDRYDMATPSLPRRANFGETTDRNYHGHLNSMNNGKTHPSYYRYYDGRLAETLAKQAAKVEKVDDARALVYKNHVLVAIRTNEANKNQVEQRVAKAIAPYTRGKHVRVVSNPSMYQRARVIDNNIRYGRPFDEIERDLKTIFYNGKIIERPANTR